MTNSPDDSGKEAVETFRRWAAAFNARDADAMIAEMHFPHMRLSGSEFQTWPTSEEFRAPQNEMTKELRAEGRMEVLEWPPPPNIGLNNYDFDNLNSPHVVNCPTPMTIDAAIHRVRAMDQH